MQAGFEPGIFRSRGGRLNHKANEAVLWLGRIASSLNRAGGGGGGGEGEGEQECMSNDERE